MTHSVVGGSLIGALLLAGPAAGQGADSQLRGTIRDATGSVVASATVTLASDQLIGGPRSMPVGPDGRWRAPALPSGEYRVTAAAPGFAEAVRDRIRLTAGATLTLDIQLDVAPLTDRAFVDVIEPAVDVTSAAVAFTIDEPMLRGLPTSRAFDSLINFAPGVAGDQAFGGSRLSNGLYVEGLNTTESSEQNPWLRFSQNWFQQVQVAGLGAPAEYGLSTGVTAYGLVRSGTNRFDGLGEVWTTPADWVANNTRELSRALQQQFASARIDAFWNANGQVGGPIRHDRLWFFTGLDQTTNDGAPAGYQGTDSQQEDDTRAIAKLTWSASPSARVEGFMQGGRRRIRNFGLRREVPVEAARAYRQTQVSGAVRLTQTVGHSLLVEAQYSGYGSPERSDPQAPGSKNGPPGHYDQLTGFYSVNLQFYDGNDRWRQTGGLTGTWFGAGSRHELEFGLQVERTREETIFGYPGGRTYLDRGGVPDLVFIREESRSRGDTARATFYVQDRLQLGPRVTLSPGLRLDRFRWATAEAANVLKTSPLSPRIGVAWDVRADHRTVVRAHYGRYTDPAFAQPILLTDNANFPTQITARVIAPDVFEELSRTDTSSRGRRIDPDIRHSYVDQFVGGVEHQLGRRLAILGQYVHREFRSFMAYVPENVEWLPVERRDPGPDGVLGNADDGALFTVYSRVGTGSPVVNVYTNLEDGWRRYRGAQLVLRTLAAGPWHVQASLTRSQTRGPVSTALHINAGVRFPGATNPNRLINSGGATGFDPTNELKALAVWNPTRWGGWTVSGVYRYLTGGAWGRTFFASGLAQGGDSILVEPRGTHRLAAINQLDLHLEKTVRARRRTLGGYADVFNVWNQGVPDSELGDVVASASGPNLGVPTRWRAPRQVRLGLRLTF